MEISLEDIQSRIYEILRYVAKLCDENNIKYYLAYGTLLGAVRHQDFIPWDDDIDIFMPRSDYYKLVEVMNKNPHPYYELIARESYPEFTAPLPKVVDKRTHLEQKYLYIEKVPLGLYIDIFILDGLGNTMEEAKKTFIKSRKLYLKWLHADTKMFVPGENPIKGILRWIRNIPDKVIGIRKNLDNLETFNGKKSFWNSKYVACLDAGVPGFERNIREFDEFSIGKKLYFRNEMFNVPEDYDKVLTAEYGDYMKLPSKEKQISHHDYELKWIQ